MALVLLACIRRTPVPEQAAAVQPPPPAAAAAAPTQERPTGNYGKVKGMDLLGGMGIRAFGLQGETKRVDARVVKVQGQPFAEAMRVKILEPSVNNWDVQVRAPSIGPIERGDVLLATFYFRTDWAPAESAEGQTEFVMELARSPWTKIVTHPVRASKDWKKVYVPFRSSESFKASEAQMIFRLGFNPERIEIGGVTVENFEKKLVLADLPTTRDTYLGIEPEAAWRAEAAARIEQHRKATLVVEVRDKANRPLPAAQVHARLVRHAFGFGTCAPAEKIVGPAPNQYQTALTELFNVVTLENDLKWPPVAGDWGKSFTIERAQSAVANLRQRGLDVRGHVLVWPGWTNLPKYLRQYEGSPERLRTEVSKHITELATAMRGSLLHWDVLNEPFDNRDLLNILGEDVIVDWFKLARAADPTAKLFINDYAILSGGGGQTAHRDHYEKTIRLLVEKGAPLDGIGMQGHFGTSLTAPNDLLGIVDRYAKFGKPIWITEYDIVMDDEELAASYTRDFYTTLFSHPAVGGIVMWGFWDGSHWKNNAPMYRRDFSLKPSGQELRKLLLESWKTDETGNTDSAGNLSVRGYLGTYEIEAMSGVQRKTVKVTLESSGSRVVIGLGTP